VEAFSLVIARREAPWQSSSSHAERSDADFFAVEDGQTFHSPSSFLISGARAPRNGAFLQTDLIPDSCMCGFCMYFVTFCNLA
jgi:hypothetical protein